MNERKEPKAKKSGVRKEAVNCRYCKIFGKFQLKSAVESTFLKVTDLKIAGL